MKKPREKGYLFLPFLFLLLASPVSAQNFLTGKDVFLRTTLPQKECYFNELIPIDITLYLIQDENITLSSLEGIEVDKENFLLQGSDKPIYEEVEIDGKKYHSFTYKSYLIPLKTGEKITINCSAKCFLQVTRERRGSGFLGFVKESRGVSIPAPITFLKVFPLPQGAPTTFNGAVGSFSLQTSASPLKCNVGDPLTLKAQISGKGNFTSVNMPELIDTKNWKTYSAKSVSSNDTITSKTTSVTFEQTIVPLEQHREIPGLVFTYFDPQLKEYNTIQSAPIEVLIEKDPFSPRKSPSLTQQETLPLPQKKQEDILSILTDPQQWTQPHTSLLTTKTFWIAQSLPTILLLSLFFFRVGKKYRIEKKEKASIQTPQVLLKEMKEKNLSKKQFYKLATQYLHFFNRNEEYEELSPIYQRRDFYAYGALQQEGNQLVENDEKRHVLNIIEKITDS